jgi:hypothetical protein
MSLPPSRFALTAEVHGFKAPPKDEEKPYTQYLAAMKTYELCEKTPLPPEAFGEVPGNEVNARDSAVASTPVATPRD